MREIIDIKIDIYPLPGLELSGEHAIADHINLSGSSPRHIGFIPVTDLYVDKHNPQAILVVCLKEGVEPSKSEAEILKKQGVQAYSYSLLEPALCAAAEGKQVKAVGFIPALPQGFQVAGLSAGLKADTGKKDLGIIYSISPCIWAGVFTKNKSRAICVEHNIALLGKKIKAVICNSGNANACTGLEGAKADTQMREALAAKFKINTDEVLTASTGKIGVLLPVEKISSAVAQAETKPSPLQGIKNFAQAILTTDLTSKIYQITRLHGIDLSQNCSEQGLRGSGVYSSVNEHAEGERNAAMGGFVTSLVGFAKGSGMIAPNMATMLAFVLSDLRLQGCDESQMQTEFQSILQEVTDETFNAISVDGDTSTNDMVIFMSNCSGPEITRAEFRQALYEVCKNLALKIALDGEGATKLIEINIHNASSKEVARAIGKRIINSLLVKTAIFGNDPNWGRIIAAMGNALAERLPEEQDDSDQNASGEQAHRHCLENLELSILGQKVFASGLPTDFIKSPEGRNQLSGLMKKHRTISIDLNLDSQSTKPQNPVTTWGTDLSYDYVRINAEYFT